MLTIRILKLFFEKMPWVYWAFIAFFVVSLPAAIGTTALVLFSDYQVEKGWIIKILALTFWSLATLSYMRLRYRYRLAKHFCIMSQVEWTTEE